MLINGTRTGEDQSESLVKMGVKRAHLAGDIANAKAIQPAQHRTLEVGEQAGNRAGPSLAGSFPSAYLTALRPAIFTSPLRSDQRKQACWWGLPHRPGAQSRDHFLPNHLGFQAAYRAFEPKDLLTACPLLTTPVLEVRAAEEVALL